MDTPTFIAKWSKAKLSERAASQEHFIDLCRLLGVQTPAELDPVGDTFTFEKGVKVAGPASSGSRGAHGWADVWYKGRFAWEYKRKDKYRNLEEAYRQLQQYREDLDNPPLMIVSDIANYEIHTNFTGYKPEVHSFTLEELSDPGKLSLLKRVFTDPKSFKPSITVAAITEKVASKIGTIAQALRDRGHEPHDAAHFLMKVMFCLFAEDVELLPKGLFQRVLTKSKDDPARLQKQMDALFEAMRTGGDFGVDEISYFNGGLFDDAQSIELTTDEIEILIDAAVQDWSVIEPSILGTLFERSLDPSKRSQIGAHYTSREDIMLVIEPVIVRPLRKQWEETKELIETQLERRRKSTTKATKAKADAEIANLLDGFQDKLSSVRVLDPACGSGNFLYVAIQQLLFLEKEVVLYASREELGFGGLLPRVRPTQLLGIEINPYASELAQVAIWIGYLQWMRDNGFNAPKDPILEPIDTIENRDAILAWADESGERISVWREGAKCLGQAEWPEADFIVGNPPFLGGSLIWESLGTEYRDELWKHFAIPNFSDLCCYWFAQGSIQLKKHPLSRFGLLATQAIRGSTNRTILNEIVADSMIFDAWSDLNWILDGAAVHISIVCFSTKSDEPCTLNGNEIHHISPTLTAGVDIAESRVIPKNTDLAWVGTKKSGLFNMNHSEGRELLASGGNPNGLGNLSVVKPWVQGKTVGGRNEGKWIIDFGIDMPISEASLFEKPFHIVKERVYEVRQKNKRKYYRDNWWRHAETRSGMRNACLSLTRCLLTVAHSKHRLYSWMQPSSLPDGGLFIFARSDDYFFGTLHSSINELWALRQGTQLEDRPRYTPTTCFETFPLPWSPGDEPGEGDPQRPLHDAIGDAAATLNEQRERWLNPPEWVKPIADKIDAEDDFADVLALSGEEAQRLIRQSAIDAACAKDPKLKKRTLTNLYNERPTWLRLAHKALDEAVIAAYAAVDPEGEWDTAWAEVFEETGAGQPLPDGHELIERRQEVEQLILGNLLRMNQERASCSQLHNS
tara:strand:+ start:2864 stop:5938 length:3075 start_codon:yes stop_codon:yes gene_type:complete